MSQDRLHEAGLLAEEGQTVPAFRAYLDVPNAAWLAARIGRAHAEECLVACRAMDSTSPVVRAQARLVEGDLLLRLGRKDDALTAYRQALRDPRRPADYYGAEPPATPGGNMLAEPFIWGPGSHRDNWLIRRFIALQAWDEATEEYARIWKLHTAAAAETAASGTTNGVPVGDGASPSVAGNAPLARGFDALGLQFATDYATFLRQRGRTNDSLAILWQPFESLDLDRDPNAWSRAGRAMEPFVRVRLGHSGGLARRDFVRLAFGAWKQTGRDSELASKLEALADRRPAAWRVLALVRTLQGDSPGALAADVRALDLAGLNDLTRAYRLGHVYEQYRHAPEAIDAYRKALALLGSGQPLAPSDPEERDSAAAMMTQRAVAFFAPPSSPEQVSDELNGRLERLYSGQGLTNEVLALVLQRLDRKGSSQAGLDNPDALEAVRQRFATAQREPEFRAWADRQMAQATNAAVRAALFWVTDRRADGAAAATEAIRTAPTGADPYPTWAQRFATVGKDAQRSFVQAVLKACPKHVQANLDWYTLEQGREGTDAIPLLESLLTPESDRLFSPFKGSTSALPFRNRFDVAYRLLRLYAANGSADKTHSLIRALAAGAPPFGKWWTGSNESYVYRDENNLPEDLAACLALAVQLADAPLLDELDATWRALPDCAAKRQVQRRKTGWPTAAQRRDIGWTNAPAGARILVSHRQVLSLAADARHVYAGHPWGVAVYDRVGRPVTRVLLGRAALCLAAQDGEVWIGTPTGLSHFRFEPFALDATSLDYDVTPRNRDADRTDFLNGVATLALHEGQLWIGTRRNVQRLDLRTHELRVFSTEELLTDSHADWKRFLFDGLRVWADGDAGLRRYDRATDTWAKPLHDGKPVRLMDLIGERLYGTVHLPEPVRDRPCVINRETLDVTPILMASGATRSEQCVNGPFAYLGDWAGRHVFTASSAWYLYDPAGGPMQPVRDATDSVRTGLVSAVAAGLRSGRPWRHSNGKVEADDSVTHRHEVDGVGFHASMWTMITLADGTRAIGGRGSYAPRYQYPREDWPFTDMAHECDTDEAGLLWLAPGTAPRRLPGNDWADVLPGDNVFALVPGAEPGVQWVCTDGGLARLDARGNVGATVTRADGLCANRVLGGVTVGQRTFFATGWGDHGGGLAVLDAVTRTFTGVFVADGLATDKLRHVRRDGSALQLTYDIEYGRGGGYNYRLFPPGTIDPQPLKVARSGAAEMLDQNEAHKRLDDRNPTTRSEMAWVGGYVLGSTEIDGRTWQHGTRGLTAWTGEPPELACGRLSVQFVADPAAELRRQAEATAIKIASPEDLMRYASATNPFVAVRAAAVFGRDRRADAAEYVPALAAMVRLPNLRARSTALFQLSRIPAPSVADAVAPVLSDPDPYLRAFATLIQAEHGRRGDLRRFEEILRTEHGFGNLPYDLTSSVGVVVDVTRAFKALVPYADEEVFAFMLRHPIYADDYAERRDIFVALGPALLAHPKAAAVLLAARTTPNDPGPESNYGPAMFAQTVFRHAGPGMLPVLHEALRSGDRVVRSNAARACGAIGQAESIPHLIQAMDLESGLARGSIVWALGKLKAREALPMLFETYGQVRRAEGLQQGGFLAAQSQSQIQSQFVRLGSDASLEATGDELRAIALPEPVDPAKQERLLSTEIVLQAVRAIGPENAQGFYRGLAGDDQAAARAEAARGLAACVGSNVSATCAVLRNLSADKDPDVRAAAEVSRLILGDEPARAAIVAALADPNGRGDRRMLLNTLRELDRAIGRVDVSFARDALNAIAAADKTPYGQGDTARRLLARLAGP
jgi:HEAT repeat protein/tetratricopeptide (TPR) repeat protein